MTISLARKKAEQIVHQLREYCQDKQLMCSLRSLFCENSDDDVAGSQKSGANCISVAGITRRYKIGVYRKKFCGILIQMVFNIFNSEIMINV